MAAVATRIPRNTTSASLPRNPAAPLSEFEIGDAFLAQCRIAFGEFAAHQAFHLHRPLRIQPLCHVGISDRALHPSKGAKRRIAQTQGSITIVRAGSDVMKGRALSMDSSAVATHGNVFVTLTATTMTWNRTTTGGIGHDHATLWDSEAGVWRILVEAQTSGDDATPFSVNGNAITKPEYSQQRFGFNLGGPLSLGKLFPADKTFFFLNYQGQHGSNPYSGYAIMPDEAMRAGDFSSLLARGIVLYDPQQDAVRASLSAAVAAARRR